MERKIETFRRAGGSCILLLCLAMAGGCGEPVGSCSDGSMAGSDECNGRRRICDPDSARCGPGPICGDDVAEDPEACDGADLAGEDCESQGFTSGTLACSSDCGGFDTTGCTVSVCGDDVADESEVCDGTDLASHDCASQGLSGGTLHCLTDCSGFDVSSCTGCGNDLVEDEEGCDGTDMGHWAGATCADFDFAGGNLACNATCDNVSLTACTGGPVGWACPPEYYGTGDGCDCGCGVIDPDCIDGTVESCEWCGGAGACSALGSECPADIHPTKNWLCEGATASCGDGVAEFPEQCDDVDLQGLDCTDFEFTGGALGCTVSCTFDTAGCVDPLCGNGTKDGTEVCDGADLDERSCTDLGFAGGTLACLSDCSDFDVSSCEDTCGNGVAELEEWCDGADLGFWTGGTCHDFGFFGGPLTCNATCDNFDLSACEGGPPGWTCPAFFYGSDDGCDCGCGVIDPDCDGDTVASCDYCDGPGSCTPIDSDCPSVIVPEENWRCEGTDDSD